MNMTPKTVQQFWADRCGIDWDDERAIEPHLYGWPDKYDLFRDGWDSACLEAQAWLKEGETIAQALQRKHDDTTVVLNQLVAATRQKERLESELTAAKEKIAEQEAQIKALREDAERLDWVIDNCIEPPWGMFWYANNDKYSYRMKSRSAIDAARKK